MHKAILGALALAASTTFALALEDNSISAKAMHDQPGTKGGHTGTPTAPAEDGNLTTKAMRDQPGTKGGRTGTPTAKAEDGNLTTKAMRDQPGTR